MIATARDVDGAEVLDRAEAAGLHDGLPARGWGLALKCEDGQMRGVPPAVIAVLERLGEIAPSEIERLGDWRRPIVRNHAGLEVGSLETTVRVSSPAAR